jgi:hypothetical protein
MATLNDTFMDTANGREHAASPPPMNARTGIARDGWRTGERESDDYALTWAVIFM